MKKSLKSLIGIGTIFLFILALMAAIPTPSDAKLPKLMTITCYPIGSSSTIMTTGFTSAIEKLTGIRCRPTPADADQARLLPVKKGEAEATVITAATVYQASRGVGDFSKKNWGPQRIRYVFGGSPIRHGMGVKANSGIKTWADLKGKRVAVGVGVNKLTIPGFLAYGNLTMDDVVVVPAGGYMHSIKTVMSGGADACHVCPQSPIVKEWESNPYGLRYLPMDKDDKAAWERMKKVAPFMAAPSWTTEKDGAVGEGGPKWLAYYPNTMSTYDRASEEIIYTIVKCMAEGRDLYKDVLRPHTEKWTMEISLDLSKPIAVPFHPGFVKYAREKGVWTAEHEAFQTQMLKEEEERIKAWKAKK